MDKKIILLAAAGVTGLVLLARGQSKASEKEEPILIPEMPKPGTKVPGQASLRGQFLSFLKQLKDMGYVESEAAYKEIIDSIIAVSDEDMREALEKALTVMVSDGQIEGVFKESVSKDIKEAAIRFATAQSIKLDPEDYTTSGFGNFGRYGRGLNTWRQGREERRAVCPYALDNEILMRGTKPQRGGVFR